MGGRGRTREDEGGRGRLRKDDVVETLDARGISTTELGPLPSEGGRRR